MSVNVLLTGPHRLSWLSMRRWLQAALAGLSLTLLSCADPCACPLGGYCNEEGQCTFECEVDADCPSLECPSDESCCSPRANCLAYQCVREVVTEDQCGPAPEVSEGWDDAPGSGEAYIMSRMRITSSCLDDGPCANALLPIHLQLDYRFQTSIGVNSIRALAEITGRDQASGDFDRSVTVKVYQVIDADDPTMRSNDFRPYNEGGECCKFRLKPDLPPEIQNPLGRWPGRLRAGGFESLESADRVAMPFSIVSGTLAPMLLHDVAMRGTLGPDGKLSTLEIFGNLRPSEMWMLQNSACQGFAESCPRVMPEDATFLDFVFAASGSPDLDRNGDGLECLYDSNDDGIIDRCCAPTSDGTCNPICATIDPTFPSTPSTCALNPALQDAYSVAFTIDLVPATLLVNP
jgi:hypothetical protein